MSFLISILLTMAAHEMGHIIAATWYGITIRKVSIGWLGIYVLRTRARGWPEVSICLAGIVVNTILAVVFWHCCHFFALANFTFAWVNLMPIPHSDGRHALEALRA